MAKRLNGALKWAAIILTLLGIFAGTIWNAATLHNDVAHLRKTVDKIEAKLDQHLADHH
jgi:hypothetical protein